MSSSENTTFGRLPPVLLLPVHLSTERFEHLRSAVKDNGGLLADSLSNAGIVVTAIRSRRRAELEIQCLERVTFATNKRSSGDVLSQKSTKRQKLELTTNSETTEDLEYEGVDKSQNPIPIVIIDWLTNSLAAERALPLEPHMLLEHRASSPSNLDSQALVTASPSKADIYPHILVPKTSQYPSLATSQAKPLPNEQGTQFKSSSQRMVDVARAKARKDYHHASTQYSDNQPRQELLRRSTSSFEEDEDLEIPVTPLWVKERKQYSCQRCTPQNSPNRSFIDKLGEIKHIRLLEGDEIGVRAYSTSAAAIAAYPFTIRSTREILKLPGCDSKIAALFHEWRKTGCIAALDEAIQTEIFAKLELFYNIWGVGAATAREFYYNKGWRDLDDVIEFGWNQLTRTQQIGVKFYDDFLVKIPRPEVEQIATTIHEHACRICPGVQYCVVGGYRRGNTEIGDVDILLSHKDEHKTLNLVGDIVHSLEEEGLVTHTLLLSMANSQREQQPSSLRRVDSSKPGFDTLDKALLVWKSPHAVSPGDTKSPELEDNSPNSMSNLHRRVDIIISPWKTVGCAMLGWSGATTFQRDLRRYSRKERNWRFDSSGIRDRGTGQFVPIEGPTGVDGDMVDAEKAVFSGLGLEYREPCERCTG